MGTKMSRKGSKIDGITGMCGVTMAIIIATLVMVVFNFIKLEENKEDVSKVLKVMGVPAAPPASGPVAMKRRR